MARKSGIEVTGRVIGTPNRELIFELYREFGVPKRSDAEKHPGDQKEKPREE